MVVEGSFEMIVAIVVQPLAVEVKSSHGFSRISRINQKKINQHKFELQFLNFFKLLIYPCKSAKIRGCF